MRATAEARAGGGNGDIADRHHAHAAAKRLALDPADQRLRQLVEGLEHEGELGRLGDSLVPGGGLLIAHPAKVAAGAEAGARAGQDDGADGGVGGKFGGGVCQLGDHPGIQGVVLFGPVQGQGGDPAGITGDRDRFVGHLFPSGCHRDMAAFT
jgi:hypothetical protein